MRARGSHTPRAPTAHTGTHSANQLARTGRAHWHAFCQPKLARTVRAHWYRAAQRVVGVPAARRSDRAESSRRAVLQQSMSSSKRLLHDDKWHGGRAPRPRGRSRGRARCPRCASAAASAENRATSHPTYVQSALAVCRGARGHRVGAHVRDVRFGARMLFSSQ